MTSNNLQIVPLENDDDIAPISAILQESLNFPPIAEFDWLTRMGRENVRIAKLGSEVAGGAMLAPLGQSFGGRFLPMVGIHGVAVATQHRGKGVATELMASVVRELRERGCPLSVLYPATQPVYRGAGYEQAGVRVQYRTAVAGLASRDRDLPVRPFTPGDQEAIDAIYRQRALSCPGHVERTPWSWQRIISRWNRKTFGYVLEGEAGVEGDLEGYAFFAKTEGAFPRYGLEVIDYGATTDRALGRLMTLLGDHRSMARELTWCGAPADPLLLRVAEQEHEVAWRMIWMLRIVDVEKALVLRGYPSTLTQLELRVRDDLIPQNNASFALSVENGEASVHRSETREHDHKGVALDVSIQALAPLYSGYFTATQLRAMGRLSAGDHAVELADALFSGPTPWMSDMF